MEQNQNVQEVVPAPISPNPSAQQTSDIGSNSNNKKKLFIIGAVAFVLLLIISVGFVLIFSKKSNNTPIPTTIPTVKISPTLVMSKLGENLILRKGIPTQIPGTDLQLTFVKRDEPENGCNDCITTTNIKMKTKVNTVELYYSCGGFAGDCSRKESGLGFVVEIKENLDPNQIIVSVTRK